MDMQAIADLSAKADAAKAAYQAKAQEPESVWRPLHEAHIALRKQLAEVLAEGANQGAHTWVDGKGVTHECTGEVIGMMHHEDAAKPFEVGCVRCPAKARAALPDLAVTRWNEQHPQR